MSRKKKNLIAGIVGFMIILGISYLATIRDAFTETNVATGAIRTKMRYGLLFETHWDIYPTWASASAARQGIDTENQWRPVNHNRTTILMRQWGYSNAPASEKLGRFPEDVITAIPIPIIDAFVSEFSCATEEKRISMIKEMSEGRYTKQQTEQ